MKRFWRRSEQAKDYEISSMTGSYDFRGLVTRTDGLTKELFFGITPGKEDVKDQKQDCQTRGIGMAELLKMVQNKSQ